MLVHCSNRGIGLAAEDQVEKRDVACLAWRQAGRQFGCLGLGEACRGYLAFAHQHLGLTGMGERETYEVTQLVRRLHRDQKLSIVLIEHDMRVVFNLADRITVLTEGRLLAEGTPAEIAGSPAVQEAYLGKAE